jgi:hypothetical protein
MKKNGDFHRSTFIEYKRGDNVNGQEESKKEEINQNYIHPFFSR